MIRRKFLENALKSAVGLAAFGLSYAEAGYSAFRSEFSKFGHPQDLRFIIFEISATSKSELESFVNSIDRTQFLRAQNEFVKSGRNFLFSKIENGNRVLSQFEFDSSQSLNDFLALSKMGKDAGTQKFRDKFNIKLKTSFSSEPHLLLKIHG